MKKILIIFTFLLISNHLSAQYFEIGSEIGFGQFATINSHNLFSKYSDNNYKVGILASYNPKKTILFINSGLLFQLKGNYQGYLENLKIPVGLDVFLGERFGYIIGGGFYLNYCYNTTGKVLAEVKETQRDLQFGSFFDIGGKFKITNFLSIFLKFQFDFDLTPLYKEGYYSAGGWLDGYDKIKSQEYSVNLGLMYRMHKKIKNNSG